MNIIIYSYTMNVLFNEKEFTGVFITTKKRQENLFFLEFTTFESIINECINDYSLII
jgi:hypothetical protein